MPRTEPLLHPGFVGAVAVLAVNDHVLKHAWPGLLSGKLSDFAGLAIIAVLLTVVLAKRMPALTLAALAFTALKTIPAVAVLAAPVLGGITRTDPTDLVALSVLWPTYWFLGRFPETIEREDGALIEQLRHALLMVVGAITVLTVTATSCLDAPEVEGFAEHPDGLIAIGTVGQYLSRDGGVTWALDGSDVRFDRIESNAGCLDDGRCFQVVDNGRIEERIDGQWITAFTFSDEEIKRMDLRSDGCSGRGDTDDLFDSLAIADSDAGQTVVVSMRSQGVLRLDAETSEWSRHAVGLTAPLDTYGPRWVAYLQASPLLLLLAGPALVFVNRRSVPTGRRVVAMCLASAIGTATILLAGFIVVFSTPDYFDFGVGLAVFSVLVFLVSLVIVLPKGRTKPTPPSAGPAPAPWDQSSPPGPAG